MTAIRAAIVCGLGQIGCEAPSHYQPQLPSHIVLEILVGDRVRNAIIEIDLPLGFVRTGTGEQASIHIHDAFFERARDRVYFSVWRFWPGGAETFDPRPCQGSAVDASAVQLVHEQGPHGSQSELCVRKNREVATSFLARTYFPIDDNWIECHGSMGGGKANDASGYSEQQRQDVLDVCRSMHVIGLTPAVLNIGEHERRLLQQYEDEDARRDAGLGQ